VDWDTRSPPAARRRERGKKGALGGCFGKGIAEIQWKRQCRRTFVLSGDCEKKYKERSGGNGIKGDGAGEGMSLYCDGDEG